MGELPVSTQLRFGEELQNRLYQAQTFEEFDSLGNGTRWNNSNDVGGVVESVSSYGTATLRQKSGTTANTGTCVAGPANFWPAVAATTREFIARIRISDEGDDKTNVFAGYRVSPDQDILQDSGAGPDTTDDTYGVYKVQDDENWWCIAVLQGSGEIVKTRSSMKAGERNNQDTVAWQTVRTLLRRDGDLLRCQYFVDPRGFGDFQLLRRASDDGPIEHIIDVTSGVRSMGVCVAQKNGDTTEQKLFLDYWAINSLRADTTI